MKITLHHSGGVLIKFELEEKKNDRKKDIFKTVVNEDKLLYWMQDKLADEWLKEFDIFRSIICLHQEK